MAAPTIKIKRSAVSGNAPTTAQLELGELALNTYDGKLFTEIEQGSSGPSIVEIGSKLSTLDVSGAAAFAGAVDIAGATGISGATTFTNNVTFGGVGSSGDKFTFTGDYYDARWDYDNSRLEFDDNAKATFGTGEDFRIYYNGSSAYLDNQGGHIYIRNQADGTDDGGDIILQAKSGEYGLVVADDSSVYLYHNGSSRLQTTSSGVNVSGTTTDDGANHDGDVNFHGNSGTKRLAWDKSQDQLEFRDNIKAVFGVGSDFSVYHDGTDNQIKSANGKVVVTTTAGNSDIEITPHGSGNVKLDGLAWPNSDGSENQSLVTNGSGTLSWSTIAGGTNTYTTRQTTTATQGQTAITVTAGYTSGFVDLYLNGVRLISGTDFTETNATTVTLAQGATAGDEIETVAWKTLGDVVNINSVNVIDNLSITGITTGTGGFVGALTGNVTGNVTGDVDGDCSGIAAQATALQTARNFSLTGEITASDTSFNGSADCDIATTIADDVVDAANLKVSNNSSASDGQALVKRSGNTGGMTWETISGGGGLSNFTESENTSSPNNTVSANRLLATGSASNIDAVFQPKGTGAILAQLPDGSTSGGNKRGNYAVDLQTASRNNANQVASGTGAVICGGKRNRVSGYPYSTIVGGQDCTISNGGNAFIGGGYLNTISGGGGSTIVGGVYNTSSASYSTILGVRSKSRWEGHITFGATSDTVMGNKGGQQGGITIYQKQTTNATTTSIATNAYSSGDTLRSVTLPNNSAFGFKITVVAAVTSGGDSSMWTLEGLMKRGSNASSTTIVGSVNKIRIAYDSGASGWDVNVSANTSNGTLRLQVTGQASTTIRWVAKIETTELSYS